MKITAKMVLGSLVASLLISSAKAQDPLTGLYFKVDAGGNWTRGTQLREFFGPVTPGSRVEFDPGPRFGLTAGYDLVDWFGVEAQIGVMENEISSISQATELDARLINVPFMVNGRFHLPTYFRVSPYIGAGAGGASTILDSGRITVNDTSLEGYDTDTVFAWQAFAGVRFSLTQHMGLSFEYRYFESDSPRWRADFAFGTDTSFMRFGKIHTQAISVAFDWTF
jgi:opacity protein-like surface antigen